MGLQSVVERKVK